MSRRSKAVERVRANPASVRFDDLERALRAVGFRFDHQRGSHRFYYHDGIKRTLNVQVCGGMAKPYQVRQFLSLIDEFGLTA